MQTGSVKADTIRTTLRRRISAGEFGPNGRIPSERDLSAELGASRVTISRAISHLVQEGVLYRRAARGAVYVNAESGQASRTGCITMVLGRQVRKAEHNPFFHGVFVGVEEAAAEMGLSVLVQQLRVVPGVEGSSALAGAGQTDGLIVGGMDWTAESAEWFKRLGRPIVSVQNDGSQFGITSIAADDEGCTTQLVEHLLDMGHRRIAFVHAPLVPTNNRLRGYQIAHLHRQLAIDPSLDIEITTRDPDVGYQSLDRVLASKATAVFCEDDCLAVGLIAACHDRGIAVPRDLSIAGFGDLMMDMQVFPRIQLTTASIPVEAMGRLALEQLMNQMGRKTQDALALKIMVPTTFIPRLTTCPPTSGQQ